MWKYPTRYDVIVVGAGHAGCEAAQAAARKGCRTLLLTMNLDTIGKMSCNPAIGGIGKGHIVREIDALGGIMGKLTDATGIQFRMLNAAKGPAVWAPRAQADKTGYQFAMKYRLEKTPHLDSKQGTIEEIFVENNRISGVGTKEGIFFATETLILSSGTFLRGLLHIGDTHYRGGRAGDAPAMGLSSWLESQGFRLGRLKTGTPPRLHRRSIDFSLTEEQPGEEGIRFSYDPEEAPRLPQVSCHITHTTAETKKIITENLSLSPLFSGKIESIGPRYCPSIEDKVVRFADKESHQIFLEPEGLQTEEIYANGISSSLPFSVQLAFIQSIPSLRNAEIMRPAYAIEYDYVESGQIDASLETHRIPGLFLAGQINGTTGYEEAAAQGLIAGINAANKVQGKAPFVLRRSEAYIGVMIDDLITKGLDEPYRMFTSRAEHRLLLRQDNADLRLRKYGYEQGLITKEQMRRLEKKENATSHTLAHCANTFVTVAGKGSSLAQLLRRPEMTYSELLQQYPEKMIDNGVEINQHVEFTCKYAGYIERQEQEVKKLAHLENKRIPPEIDYKAVQGLRFEAQQKLSIVRPRSLGQASRIPGVSPADIQVLLVYLQKPKCS